MKIHLAAPACAKKIGFAAALFILASGTAQAQANGVVATAKQNPIPVYKSPDDAEPAEKLAVNGLPWPILETKDGFFLVAVGGKRVWVDSMDVTASRESSNRCSPKAGAKGIAGVPGAANDRC